MAAEDQLGEQFTRFREAGLNDKTATVAAKSNYSNWISPSSDADSLRDKIGWVPTGEISRLREYTTQQLREPEQLPRLAKDIAENGFKSPLILEYGKDDRRAYLGEGNHRLAVAEKMGLSHVPVHVLRSSRTREVGKPVPGAEPDRTGYVPGNLHPRDIGLPAV